MATCCALQVGLVQLHDSAERAISPQIRAVHKNSRDLRPGGTTGNVVEASTLNEQIEEWLPYLTVQRTATCF